MMRKAVSAVTEARTVAELRALDTPRGVASGYFRDHEALCEAAERLSGKAMGVFVTLNPVNPALLARARNRVKDYVRHTTADSDIVRLRWLMIDLDPKRPSGISSTDKEHMAALVLAFKLRRWLDRRGWPQSVFSDSGNGAHVLYRVDLPNDEPSSALLTRCLRALGFRFSTDQVVVDAGTASAGQLWKLPGTWACKGDDLEERPHRRAVLLQVPDRIDIVRPEQLEELAALVPELSDRTPTNSVMGFDVANWIETHDLDVASTAEWKGGRKWVLSVCPWNAAHTDRAAYIVQLPSGAVAAGCHHNGCTDNDWHALRALVEGRDGNSEHSEHSGEWSPPVPFDDYMLPSFPIDTLPDWLKAYVHELAVETQTPVDLPAMIVLSVLSAAVAKKVSVRIKDNWIEPTNIYVAVILEPGNRKSAVFRAASMPLEDYEQRQTRHLVVQNAYTENQLRIAEERLKRAQMAAAKAKPEDQAALEQRAEEYASAVMSLQRPGLPRLLVDDITLESLGTVLYENHGRIALMSAEGGVFDMIGGRYSANGAPSFDIFLKGHSSDAIRVDRIGRGAEYIANPAITVGITIQPEVLRGLIRRSDFRGRGLLGRFLYSLPVSLLGRRQTDPIPMSPETAQTYATYVERLLGLPSSSTSRTGETDAGRLRLSPQAWDVLQQFAEAIEPQLDKHGELGAIQDWAGKLVGTVGRLAGLLHMANHAKQPETFTEPINAATVSHAIEIGEYLIAHAQAAFAAMGADPAVEDARYLLGSIIKHALMTFSVRELFQVTRGRFKKVDALQPGLTVLVEHGFIRARVSPTRSGPGRKPSPSFDVHPTVSVTQNAQNPQNSLADLDPASTEV